MSCLAINTRIYTSGVRRFDLLEQAVQRAGPRKILFGSDGPWLHPGVDLAKVRALGLPPQHERLMLGENFLRLIARIGTQSAFRPVTLAGTARPRPARDRLIESELRDPWISEHALC